jgi:transcriptional regulator with XRE-family HTH domain
MTQSEWRNIFSDNLIDILEERGMTQSQLAFDSGLSVSRISDYVNKRAIPTVFAVINMAYALDMEVGELIDFDERITQKED